ncbi:MAG: hypothetical protein ACYC69_16355 [Thermodesulfovibrionales bacterium]
MKRAAGITTGFIIALIVLMSGSVCFAAPIVLRGQGDVAVAEIKLDNDCDVQVFYKNVGTTSIIGDIEFKTFLDGTQKSAMTLNFSTPASLAPGTTLVHIPGYKVTGTGTVKALLKPKYKGDLVANNEMTKNLTCKPATRLAICAPKTRVAAKFDDQYLKSSFDSTAAGVNINNVELTLVSSFIMGDFVDCHYKSNNNDINNLVYHFSCKGAVKDANAPHGYQCTN